ncbi:MAG: hypothetical protein V1760_02600 [Candidatus Peregrinibacteria bacterium]
MIPQVTGVSELQRNSKKVLQPIKEGKEDVVLLSDRNHVFGAIVNIDHYKMLLAMLDKEEKDFWLRVSEKSLDFWLDPSNDVYEKML